jgi:hypothetical protein
MRALSLSLWKLSIPQTAWWSQKDSNDHTVADKPVSADDAEIPGQLGKCSTWVSPVRPM